MGLGILNVMKMVPGPVGMAASGLSLAKDVMTGNMAGAALDAVGIIPFGGAAAKLGAKTGVVNVLDRAAATLHVSKKMGYLARAASVIV